MARRSGFVGFLNAVARDTARAARQAEAARKRQQRELAKSAREADRAAARARREHTRVEKEAKQLYIQEQIEEAADQTSELAQQMVELRSVLEQTLSVDDRIDFAALRMSDAYAPFDPPKELRTSKPEPSADRFLAGIAAPRGLAKLMPGATRRHEEALGRAREAFERAQAQHAKEEARRLEGLTEASDAYDKKRAAYLENVHRRNAEVDDFEQRYRDGDADAIVAYNNMVLERSEYPDGFPEEFSVAYVRESKELVVDHELPLPSIVPAAQEVRYNKTKDEFEEKPRKATEIRDVYEDVVSSVALRTVHEIFEADQHGAIETVTFNGFVQTVDPSTGRDIKPYLISVRTTRERFFELDLRRVDKRACLRNLGAQLSPRPSEIQPVKPIVEFDMVDKRFVEQQNILGSLESRPNLMDLSPTEFETLVSNLFASLGLETRLTRSTKDGGVDVVAFDTRPVLGGKVVIQAKRYRHTVGVSAVRDLFGTMVNEGANKGILVTTSGYGSDAFTFAEDKPIELISGSGLLYLLDQVGTKARILMPTEAAG
jgi:restriction system protein